ncbi:ferrochelatase [Thermodesulfovibrio hydrogeniphilus]
MDKTGVILLNMGGPDSLDAVKPFLFNLFCDPYIANFGPMQKPFAWMISTLRSRKVKKAYGLIGGKSPLKEITLKQAELLEKSLGGEFSVKVGMNYWHPFINEALNEFENQGIKKIIALSLYPQYCKATTASIIDRFKAYANKKFDYEIISSWCDHPLFIEAWIDNIKEAFNKHGDAFVLFSAHGIPLSLHKKGDPYVSEVKRTVKAIVEGFKINEWSLCYQSRTGPVKWVEPSTEESIKELAHRNIKKVFIVPISFVSDHIETLYEIDIVYKKMAEKLGIQVIRVPSLNTSDKFIKTLKALVLALK